MNKHEQMSFLMTLLQDIKQAFIMIVLTVYYITESCILTILPDKWRNLKDVSGKVVVITGGAGGVGRLLALHFAKKGSIVVVWDINKEGLDETCSLLVKEGYHARAYVCDISDRSHVYRIAERVKNEVGLVDILVNNAGVVNCRTLLEIPDAMIQKTYDVNILSNYWTTKAFLPDMITRGDGHIVTVSSVTGLLGTYACTDYSASKFASVGFHESLLTELKAHGYENIHCTLVCPFFINTGMFNGCNPRQAMLEPDYVAEQIVRSVCKREVNCTMPGYVRTMLPLKCIFPAKLSWALMHRIIRGPQTMMQFKGRLNSRSEIAAQG